MQSTIAGSTREMALDSAIDLTTSGDASSQRRPVLLPPVRSGDASELTTSLTTSSDVSSQWRPVLLTPVTSGDASEEASNRRPVFRRATCGDSSGDASGEASSKGQATGGDASDASSRRRPSLLPPVPAVALHVLRRCSSFLSSTTEHGVDKKATEMRKMIEMGRAAKRRLRRRIAGASLAVTVLAVFAFGTLRSVLVPRIDSAYAQALASGVGGLFLALGFCGAFLAATPDDPLATRAAPLLFAAVVGVTSAMWVLTGLSYLADARAGHCRASPMEGRRESAAFCRVDAAGLFASAAVLVVAAAGLVAAALGPRAPRARHAAFRRVVAVYFGGMVGVNVYSGIARAVHGEVAWGVLNNLLAALGWAAALCLAARPVRVARAHARLGRLGDRAGATAAAAGVAGLLGDADLDRVVRLARRRFRSIRLTDLREREVRDRRPDPDLYKRTAAAALGDADAFVSHSWHDDPAAKFAALRGWCAEFERRHGRQPRLWFDKCCIDQLNLEEDLCCLPLFLSGCARLVLLAGESYASRLWCVMELFTFVHMGGSSENVDVLEAHAPGGQQAVLDSFLNFDVEKADCLDADDKERMLEVIEAAFGDLHSFNELIRPFMLRFNGMLDVSQSTHISEP